MYETYRLGILIDHLKTEDLIRQIDEYIEETPIDQIPHIFYVLSLASNRRIMIELLTDLAQGVDEELPASIVAGLLYKDRERYTVEELYRKIGMLASLLSNEDDIIASSFRELKMSYDDLQAAYGRRFKRKKQESACSPGAKKYWRRRSPNTLVLRRKWNGKNGGSIKPVYSVC